MEASSLSGFKGTLNLIHGGPSPPKIKREPQAAGLSPNREVLTLVASRGGWVQRRRSQDLWFVEVPCATCGEVLKLGGMLRSSSRRQHAVSGVRYDFGRGFF
jgi:hypothetical protein